MYNKNNRYYRSDFDKTIEANKIKNMINKKKDKIDSTEKKSKNIQDIRENANKFIYYFGTQNDVVLNGGDSIKIINTMYRDKVYDPRKVKTTQSENITQALNMLHQVNFFNTVNNTTNKAQSSIEQNSKKVMLEAVDLNYKNMNNVRATVSITQLEKQYENLNKVKNKGGYIIGFDTETIGATTNRLWSPETITEFAMRVDDIGTGKVSETNVLLTSLVDHEVRLKQIEDILKQEHGLETIMANEDLKITAQRYSLYGHKDTKVKYDKSKGHYIATSIADSEKARIGNLEQMRKGVENITGGTFKNGKLVGGRKIAIDSETGLHKDVSTVLKSLEFMKNQSNTGNAMVLSYNGQTFDEPVLNKYVKTIYDSQLSIINNKSKTIEEINQAKKGLDYIVSTFGNNPSFNLNNDYVFDVYPAFRLGVDLKGEHGFYKKSSKGAQALDGSSGKYYRQEVAAEAFYTSILHSGSAHNALSDTRVLNAFATTAMENVKGKNKETLLDYVMETIKEKTHNNAQHVVDSNQVYMSTYGNQASTDGKKVFHFMQDSKGQMITSSNHIIDSNGKVSYSDMLSESPMFQKNQFFKIKSQNKVDTRNLPTAFGSLAPEFGFSDMYTLQLELLHSDKYDGTEASKVINMMFGNKNEMEAWVSSNLSHIGEMKGNRSFKATPNLNDLTIRQFNNGKAKVNSGFYKTANDYTKLQKAMEVTEENAINRRVNKYFLQSNDAAKKISGLLDFNNWFNSNDKEKTFSSFDIARLYFDKNAAAKYGLSQNSIDIIKENLTRNLGYKLGKDSEFNDTLLNGTARNALFAYDNIDSQNDFYSNLLEFVYEDIGVKMHNDGFRATYDELSRSQKTIVNERFNLLVNQSNEYVSKNNNINIEKIVKNKKQLLIEKDYKTKYDFRLNPGFFAETKSSNIVNYNSNDYSNIVTFDLENSNSRKSFIDRLLKTKYDNVAKFNDYEKEMYSKSIVYDFVNNISESDNKDLFRHKKFKKLQNIISYGEYDLTYASMLLEEAIADTKNTNMNSGLIKPADIAGRNVSKEIAQAKNKLNKNDFKTMSANLPTIINANNDKGSVDKIIDNLMKKFYMPDRDLYEKSIAHLDSVTKKGNLILYDNLKEQMSGMMHELFSTAGYGNLSIQYDNKTGVLNFVTSEKAIPLNGLPKIILQNEELYITTPTQMFQAKHTLRTVYEKEVPYIKVGTNLDEIFGKDGAFFNDNKKSIDKQTFDLDTLVQKFSYYRRDLSDSPTVNNITPYSVKTSNSTVDTTGAHEILPHYFNPNGKYKQKVVEAIKSGKLNTPEAVRVFMENVGDDLKGETLSPTIHMLGIIDNPILYEMAAKDDNTKFIIRNMTTAGKETEVTDGQLVLGFGKPFTSVNSLDNLSRPTIMSARNTRWLKCNTIEEARKSYEGLLIEGHAISSTDIVNNIYRHVKQTEKNYVDSFSHRQLYTGVLGIESLLHSERDRVIKGFTTKGMSEAEVNRVKELYNTVSDYLKDSVYEQAKLFDPLLMEKVAGQIPQDIQRISVNTNSVPYLTSIINDKNELNKLGDKTKINEMIEALGSISIDEDGTVKYIKGKSSIVKRGDLIVPYQSYGNNIDYLTTKFNKGVLNFTIRDLEQNELTLEEINKILNDNKHIFTNDKHDNMQEFIGLFNKNKFNIGYEIENINKSELIKTSDNAAEKSMSRLWYAKTGELDDDIVKYFKSTGGDSFLYSTVLSDKSIDAYVADAERRYGTEKAQKYLEKAGMKTIEELKTKIAIEQFTYRSIIFDNEKGILRGMSGVANDNLIGHKNEGARLMSTVGEAISLVGKYQNGGIEDRDSYKKGLHAVVDFINKGGGKYDFIDKSSDGGINRSGERISYTAENFILMHDRVVNTDEFNLVNNKKLKDLIKGINDTFLKDATEEDKLYYKDVKVLTSQNTYENISEYYGHLAYITDPNTGEKIAIGSKGVVNKAINYDSETQSSVSKEYLDRRAYIMKLKEDKDLALKELEMLNKNPNKKNAKKIHDKERSIERLDARISNHMDIVNAMSVNSNPMKIDDQARTLLSNSKLDETTQKRLNLWTNTKDRNIFNEKISQGTGGLIAANESGELIINELIRSNNVNEKMLAEIKGQITFDPLSEKKLTEEMITTPKYEKYSDLFYRTQRMNMELGVDHAEQYYQGIRAVKAAQYNNGGKTSINTLLNDYDFKMINIENYASTMGRADNPVLENLSRQPIVVDLGEEFKDNRYFAVPGLGGTSGDKEIRQEWHQTMNKISHLHKEYMDQQGVDNEYTSRLRKNIGNAVSQIKQDTDNLLSKGTMFGDAPKVGVNMAYVRSKLLSTVSETTIDTPLNMSIRNSSGIEGSIHSSSFKNKAIINGKTIADWEKGGVEGAGMYFDYRVAGKQAFHEAGYFEPKFMESMGFKSYVVNGVKVSQEAQMMDYLSTHGTMDIVDRYPNIKEKSISTTRVFLDANMVGDNETLLAAHTMINLNGDSDGDSVSALFLEHKGVNYAQYNKERMAAEKIVRSDIRKVDKNYSALEIEKMIKEKTITHSKNVGVDAYDLFRGKEIEMTYRAVENRETVAESILPSFYKENERNYKNLGVYAKVDGKESNLMAQVVGGKSILGDVKLYAQENHITSGYLIDSNKKISDHMQLAYDIFNNSDRKFELDNYKYIQNVKDSTNIHEFGTKQTEALDEVLSIIKSASDNNFAGITKDVYDAVEKDVFSRIRANSYIESSISKAGKSAIGQVNASLYAVKQASEEYFGRIDSPAHNLLSKQIVFDMSDQIEQNIISYKKVQAIAGDMRLIDFNEIMSSARYSSKRGFNMLPGGNGEDLIKWTSKYLTSDVTNNIYGNLEKKGLLNDKIINDASKYIDEFLKAGYKVDEAEHLGKSRMLTEQYMKSVTEIFNNDSAMANVETHSNIGRRSSSVLRVVDFDKGSEASHSNVVLSLLFERDMSTANGSLQANNYESLGRVKDFAKETLGKSPQSKMTEKVLEDGVRALGSMNNAGLAMGAAGLVVGLMASGFAGGNPLNNANPQEMETDNNPKMEAMSVPEFFNNQGGYVTGNSQKGYIINVKADTDKGQRHMKRAMKEAVKSTAGSGVSINMNFKSNNKGGYSDRDIENLISNYI